MKNFSKEDFLKMAIEESKINSINDYSEGGPFGAVIVEEGQIISKAHNSVRKSKDATAHAEVNAIRLAGEKLGTFDLSGCVLYASAEPCPMCLSAIIWANIKEVYYANTKEHTAEIGFRDDMIYEYLEGKAESLIEMHHIELEEARKIFEDYKKLNGKNIY